MDTDGVRLFVLIARKLNISAAGKALGFAPAVASAKLAKLEHELGAELLHRTTRKVSLSLAGEQFLPFAEELVAQEEAALQALGRRQAEPSGTVRFAASSTFAQMYIVSKLPLFLARFPKINLDLRLSDTRFDLIDSRFDLVLRNDSLGDSGFKARKLADDRRVLCASPGYIKQHGLPTKPEDLSQHSLIGFQGQESKKLRSEQGQIAEFKPGASQCRLTLDDGLSQKLMTMAGAGISINSMWSVREELQQKKLVRVLPEFSVDEDIALWLVYPKSTVLSLKVRVLIDFLLAECTDTLGY